MFQSCCPCIGEPRKWSAIDTGKVEKPTTFYQLNLTGSWAHRGVVVRAPRLAALPHLSARRFSLPRATSKEMMPATPRCCACLRPPADRSQPLFADSGACGGGLCCCRQPTHRLR